MSKIRKMVFAAKEEKPSNSLFSKKNIVEIFIKIEGDAEIEECKSSLDDLLLFLKDREPDFMFEFLNLMKHKLLNPNE